MSPYVSYYFMRGYYFFPQQLEKLRAVEYLLMRVSRPFCCLRLNQQSIGSEMATLGSPLAMARILFTSFMKFCYWTRQYSAAWEKRKPYEAVGSEDSYISLWGMQSMLILSKLAGMKTGLESCCCTKGANCSILVLSPWTSMMFSGSILRRRFMIPLASAWAEKETLTTFIFTSQVLLSNLISFIPRSSLFPKVPSTQQPGMMRVFRQSAHHSLKTCMLEPPCSMPGVAKSTQGMSAFSSDLSKGFTFLNSNMLSPLANSSWIFSFCQSTKRRQKRLALSMSPAEKQIGTLLSVLFQQLQSKTDSSCARPRAKTGMSTLPPFQTVSEISCNMVRSRSLLVSLMVVAQVVSVMSRLGLSLGAEAAPRCLSAYELQSPVQTTDSPPYST